MISEFLIYIFSYLLGSINFSLVISRILKIEIEKYGDENLSATNMYYASLDKYKNKRLAFLLFSISGLLDLLKAYVPTVLFGPIAGAFAVIGHCFSIFSIVITKKIPSGVGAASAIGWLLGLEFTEQLKILMLAIPLLIVGLIMFYDIFRLERFHVYSIFLFLSVTLLYIIIFDPNEIIKISIVLLAISASFARVLRYKNVFKKLLKEKYPGGGI